ncbi:MAG: tautomerase family protein [Rhizobiales bacterium]|nr:tautomerase family protein [Hyphomicrobiales bacterium]
MPFARISLLKGKSPDYLGALSGGLHQALVEAFDVPQDDRFQVIHQLALGELIFDRHYLGGPRSDDFVLIQITAGRLRSTAVKQAFYRRLVTLLAEAPGLRPADVMVIISTTHADEWSFGGGEAQMVAASDARAEVGHAQRS